MYATLRMPGWDNEIDIQKTIQLVRAQRSGMVQTEVCLHLSLSLSLSLDMYACIWSISSPLCDSSVILLICAATVQVCVPGNSCICGVPASIDGSGELTSSCESIDPPTYTHTHTHTG